MQMLLSDQAGIVTPVDDRSRKRSDCLADSPFDRLAGEYDQWFEDNVVFAAELACLRGLARELPRPRLEIGVGPGRFAETLGLSFGIDPARGALRLAAKRGIRVCQAVGEALPFSDDCFGTLVLLFSLCFVADRFKVLQEAYRVLHKEGLLVVGMVPAASPWGKAILKKKEAGNPFYEEADLLAVEQAADLLRTAGFAIVEERCGLLQPPHAFSGEIDSLSGMTGDAGFAVLVGRK